MCVVNLASEITAVPSAEGEDAQGAPKKEKKVIYLRLHMQRVRIALLNWYLQLFNTSARRTKSKVEICGCSH